MPYITPVADIRHALRAAGLDRMMEDGRAGDLTPDLVDAILEEGGKFASEVLAPLNRKGDVEGLTLKDGVVTMPEGWSDAYSSFAEAGWTSVTADEDHGGQALPTALGMALSEMWNGANLSFGLCPLLSTGAIEALEAHGAPALQETYLTKLVTGEWTGTMNLTEPQAGSDLSDMRTQAVPQGDGTYRITGQKIYITYGEHDMAENICHLVLARLPDAPEGTRGISLFLVPKFPVEEDGSLGARNDVRCTGLEHKLGIHASPTCTMSFGDEGGALGYLVGEENKGLRCMFTMMNNARLGVGVQGVGVAEAALQQAAAYANERQQGRAGGRREGPMSPIVSHPDVKRTLLTMAALTAASRAICTACAIAVDGEATDPKAKMRADILTPVAKAFSTDAGVEVASLGVQVHGGMGFVEETGAAQFYRDARILPIYEGTNGIQAIDLVMRKIGLADGEVMRDLLSEYNEITGDDKALSEGVSALEKATLWMAEALVREPDEALAVATPYLRLFGLVAGAIYLQREALTPGDDGRGGARRRLTKHFVASLLPEASSLLTVVTTSGGPVLEADELRLTG